MTTESIIPDYVLTAMLAVARSVPAGDFAEFGVYQGGSAQHLASIAREQSRELYLFDTFEGIPVAGEFDSHLVGDFCDTSVDVVRALIPDAVMVCGVFPQSAYGLTFKRPLAFVHVDADQYESIAAACAFFPDKMCSGGVMAFDDYNILDGATRAVREWGEPIEITEHGRAMWRKP